MRQRTAFELRHGLLERRAIGVLVTRVDQFVRRMLTSGRFVFEGRAEHNRRHDGAARGINRRIVNRFSLWSEAHGFSHSLLACWSQSYSFICPTAKSDDKTGKETVWKETGYGKRRQTAAN